MKKLLWKGDKKCVISDPRRSSLACLEMLDIGPSAVFDGLMNSRPACQDKAPCLAEHGGADQIPIRKSLVSLARSEPDGQALNLSFSFNHLSRLFEVLT